MAEVQHHQQTLRDYFQQATPLSALGGPRHWSGPLALLPLWIAGLLGIAAVTLARRPVN